MCYFVIGSYNTDETSLSVALAALKIRSKSMNFQNGHSGTTGVVAEHQITRRASPGEDRAQGVVRTGPWLRSGLMWPLNCILLTWERPSARTQVIEAAQDLGGPEHLQDNWHLTESYLSHCWQPRAQPTGWKFHPVRDRAFTWVVHTDQGPESGCSGSGACY